MQPRRLALAVAALVALVVASLVVVWNVADTRETVPPIVIPAD